MPRAHALTLVLTGALALAAAGCRSRPDAGTNPEATSGNAGAAGAKSTSAVDDATMGSSMSSADADARAGTTSGAAAGTANADEDRRLETELQALDARIESTWEAFKAETADGSRRLSNEARAKWNATLVDLRRERDDLKTRIDARGERATSTAGEKIRTALNATERELDELGQRLDAAFL